MIEKTVVTVADVGRSCVYYDPRGQSYDALITAVWGPQCVNIVYVNDVENQRDAYGQKMIRAASVMHGNIQQAHGNFWLLPNEVRLVKLPEVEDSTVVS